MAKKKYSINWENDEAVSFEVNGVTYESLDDIPNWKDRDKLAAMMQAAEDDEAFDDNLKFNEKEFEQIRKAADDNSMERIVLTLFTGVAVLMLVITVVSTFFNFQKLSREESAPGRVVEVIMEREYVNQQDRIVREFYFPVVQFTAEDGRRREVKMSEGSDPPSHEVGDEVTVLYDPDHPLDARIQSFASAAFMWTLPVITGILGLAFGGGVWFVRKVMST